MHQLRGVDNGPLLDASAFATRISQLLDGTPP
jgi:hypothetical protein